MKTLVFNLFIVPALILSGIFPARAEYVKSVRRSWPVQAVNTLTVENKFGDINFIYSRDDSVVIDIRVEINNLTGTKAELLAEGISFKFASSEGRVKAATIFSDDFKTNQEFKITYSVYIPENKNLEVENKYGNVTLGNLNANGYFRIDYGNIHGNKLIAPANEFIKIELKYGSCSLAEINRIKADIAYSKFRSSQIETAHMETRYSVLSIGKCNSLLADSRYDNYKMDEVNDARIDSRFTAWNIDRLNKKLTIESEYGDIDVDYVSNLFESVSLKNRYGSIHFGIDSRAVYKLNSQASYCKVKIPGSAEKYRYIEDNNHTTIEAVVGKGEPNSSILIESSYGNVDLME